MSYKAKLQAKIATENYQSLWAWIVNLRNRIILVGASTEDFKMVQPIFDVLGKIAIHVGEPGVASSAKLAINYLLG